jgi:hypothetical protein
MAMRTDEHGDALVVITGVAAVDAKAPPADQLPAYLEKYGDGIARLGSGPMSFARSYSIAVRIRPTRLRAW